MTDLFDAKISCKNCDIVMSRGRVEHGGMLVRALRCGKCGDMIIHPEDKIAVEQFRNLKGKTFSVKLRVVGNSHAVSIPKEVVDFLHHMHNQIDGDFDKMVRLCVENSKQLSLRFDEENEHGR